MQDTMLGHLFNQGQIRLSEISVFNWGSFHQLHTARIDPEGTLITGDNGAGKSTFIDGLMALLQPAHKASFNVAAAQGERSDRSLLSYMRGSYGSAHDGSSTKVKSKREKAVTTALRALYCAEDGSQITLIALFWVGQGKSTLSDVNRLYMVASRNVLLTEVLDVFADGNTRQLKQHFNPRVDQRIHYFDSRFDDYQEMYRKYLCMDNPNAPALLSRALGLKKIDDLTKLIRELVLEPGNLKEDAQTAVREFVDLEANYKYLIDARAQVECLQPLPGYAEKLTRIGQQLEQLNLEKQSVKAYFGELFAEFWTRQLQQLEQHMAGLDLQFKQLQQQEQDLEQAKDRYHQEYLQLGGEQIEILEKELQLITDKLRDLVIQASRYQDDARLLQLPDLLEEAALTANQRTAAEKLVNIEQENAALQDQFAETSRQYAQTQQQCKDTQLLIQEIEARPETNISDIHLLRLREQLAQHLMLDADQLMFMGELIDVKEEEKEWQGAIERALGGLRTTLLVPQQHYTQVTKWVNARHNKTHVRLQVVHSRQAVQSQFQPDGFLRKLIWREHVYRDWLKSFLNRFDLHCVADTERLDQTPFSMTRQGLIHKEQGRFEKKDQQHIDDRKTWCLGFSNTSRLVLLKNENTELEQLLKQQYPLLDTARQQLNACGAQKSAWERLLTYQWNMIAVPYWKQKSEQIRQDLLCLKQADSDAEQARQCWQKAAEQLKQLQQQRDALNKGKGQLEQQHLDTAQLQQQALQAAAVGVDAQAREYLLKRIGAEISVDKSLQDKIEQDIYQQIEQATSQKNSASQFANQIMTTFRSQEKWAHIPLQREWAAGSAGLQDCIAYLQELQQEGLPDLIEQFEQRVQKHTNQSLGVLQRKLEYSRNEISERIEQINQVLQRTEFKQGSYLRLGSKKERYEHVRYFEARLKQVMSDINSRDYERRFKQLAEVMAILDKASSSATAQNMESLRLLDPRYQMSFHAEEVENDTGEIRDVLESSSGKSGGEKESFAGTIVAASLAYVLTPEGYDYPVYSTVFLDEAFSNTAEAVSRRVLRVFKALKIHVNLITPYKNLNLARESARSLLIAERDSELHESHLCEITWEEVDQKRLQHQQTLAHEAGQLGIELNG